MTEDLFKLNLSHTLVFLGERSDENQLIVLNRPRFMDAVRLSDGPPAWDIYRPFYFLPLSGTISRTFHFQERPPRTLTFTLQDHSLIITENGKVLKPKAFLSILTYFLIQQDNYVTFLVKNPKDRMKNRDENLHRIQSAKKKPDE